MIRLLLPLLLLNVLGCRSPQKEPPLPTSQLAPSSSVK